MRLLRRRTTKPKGRFAGFLHFLLLALVPATVYVLIRLEFVAFAFLVVALSKWRMFAVKPRHWVANIRTNAVDIFVGMSAVVFMSLTDIILYQIVWVVLYALWLLFMKPKSTPIWIGLQALLAQTLSLVALFLVWNEVGETGLVIAVWGVTYLCARHFLAAFDESMARASAYVWAFFAASLTWVSSHWLLYYKAISQPALILTIVGYCMAALYYLDHTERLKKSVRRQFILLAVAAVAFVLFLSEWSGEII